MKLAKNIQAAPWEFDATEVENLQTVFSNGLVRAYLSSLKYMALTNRTLDPLTSTPEEIKASNDYMCGQEHILDALLSTPIFIPKQKGD